LSFERRYDDRRSGNVDSQTGGGGVRSIHRSCHHDQILVHQKQWTSGTWQANPLDWEMHNASTDVNVKVVEPNKRILIEWGEPEQRTTVEWIFTARPDNTTFVSITNSGFQGTQDEVAQQAIGSTEGFTLCSLD